MTTLLEAVSPTARRILKTRGIQKSVKIAADRRLKWVNKAEAALLAQSKGAAQ